ncbi:hypothetical protein OSB04_013253 [Centaurea solstitialis]|uniref:Pentatricopeptide repeat-containing protein n=1 Tax=Centaurea solstitialis TaxID=347529 RepID=A0AA38TEN5_9ASTR|nr:hypothetical protein OSB04_013253 [Centaurea solstitialis]
MICAACQVFDEMPNRNVVSWTTLLKRLDEARSLFDSMTDKNVVNLLECYAIWECSQLENLKSPRGCLTKKFREEFGNSGDYDRRLTFSGLLFSHLGMVHKSWKFFNLIDVLGRTGMLTEAYELVKHLPVEWVLLRYINYICLVIYENTMLLHKFSAVS